MAYSCFHCGAQYGPADDACPVCGSFEAVKDRDETWIDGCGAEERYCYQAIDELKKAYEKAAKPYIDRIVMINSLRQPKSFIAKR